MGDKQAVGASELIVFGPHPRWAVGLTEEHHREVETHSLEDVYERAALRASAIQSLASSEQEATSNSLEDVYERAALRVSAIQSLAFSEQEVCLNSPGPEF